MLMNQAAPYSYWYHASKSIELGCCARHRSNRMTRQPSRLLSQTSRPWDQTTQECTRYVVCQLHTASNKTLWAKTRVNTGNAFSCLRSLWLWSLCSQMLCTKFRLQVTRFSYHQLILQPVQPLSMKSAGWVGICQGMTKNHHETSFCHICGLDLAWHKFASKIAIITSKHNCACSSWHIAFVFVFTSQVQGLWKRHIAPWRTRNQMYMMAKNTKRSREMWKKSKNNGKTINKKHASCLKLTTSKSKNWVSLSKL